MNLKKILEQHDLWLESKQKEGKRADLSGADLSGADLSYTNFSHTDLSGADLSKADLSWSYFFKANLSYTDLSHTDLSKTDLPEANLRGANLFGAGLFEADLFCADLSGTYLFGADLRRANLFCADLSGADLQNTVLDPRNKPNEDVSDFEINEDKAGNKYVIGFRSPNSEVINPDYVYKTGWHKAPVFSTCNTMCHPGLYFKPKKEKVTDIKVKAYVKDVHKAGEKWRCRKFFVYKGDRGQ